MNKYQESLNFLCAHAMKWIERVSCDYELFEECK